MLNRKYIFPLSFSILYFISCILWGLFQYPHEDVLILYRYVDIFAHHNIIAFNPNGPPVEGATDFLWMAILALFHKIGFDPFLTSQIINAISLFFILRFIFTDIIPEQPILIYTIIGVIFLNIGPIVASSILGFSSLTFCFLLLAIYIFAIKTDYLYWTTLSIIFCLLRPEAFIFFLPTILIIFYKTKANNLSRFYKSFFTIVSIGIIYFLWRFWYFNEFLPTPIIVKSIGGETSITRYFARMSEVLSSFIIAQIIVIFIYVISNLRSSIKGENKIFNLILVTFPFILIFIFMLSTGHASQNIFFRYFSPIYLALFIFTLLIINDLKSKKFLIYSIIFFIFLTSIDQSNLLNRTLDIENKKIANPSTKLFKYFESEIHPITHVGLSLEKYENDLTLMLTEAGNIPFFSQKYSIDMAGLNTSSFAKEPVNCEHFISLKPDIIEIDVGPIDYFHYNEIINDKEMPSCGIVSKNEIFKDPTKIRVDKSFLIDRYKNDYFVENHKNATVAVAANNTLFCMNKSKNFDRIFFNKRSDQIYFHKSEEISELLMTSCDLELKGYFLDNLLN